jgi:hypothetical protein
MMTPEEAGVELARLFSGPSQPPGKDRWHHLQYIPVQFPNGVEFIRDPFDAQMDRIFAEIMEELFEPEPAEDSTSSRPHLPNTDQVGRLGRAGVIDVRFALHCRRLAALPRTAGPGQKPLARTPSKRIFS